MKNGLFPSTPSRPRSSLQTTMLPVLLLENILLRSERRHLQKQSFMSNLKQSVRQDLITGTEIGPLTRNQQPNASILNIKVGTSSEAFGNLIHNFEVICKNCHVCGSSLFKEYRQRVNEIEKYMKLLDSDRKKVEQREKQLTEKIKGLRFQSVPTTDTQTQTETSLDQLIKREIDHVKADHDFRDQQQESGKVLDNKQNYLQYMEEIVNKRQQDLDRKEAQLVELEQRINIDDVRFKTEPLSHLTDSKRLYDYFYLLKDRIYDAVIKYESGEPQLLKLLENHPLYDLFEDYDSNNQNPTLKFEILKIMEVNILELRYKLEVAEQYFYSECQKVEDLKKTLEEKNVKFVELNSYEHFLDRYRGLLDEREGQVTRRNQLFQQEMKAIMEYLDIRTHPSQEQSQLSSFSFLQHIDKETKSNHSGRGRIFTLRQHTTNIIEEYKSLKPDLEKQFLSQKVNKMKEEYDAQCGQVGRIQELERENQYLRTELTEKRKPKVQENGKEGEYLDDILVEAQKKKRVINCLSKWLRVSFFKNIKNVHLNKGLAFLVWRSKQYDPQSFDRIKELMEESYETHEEQLWAKKCQVLKKQKLFPYKSLSLKRKEFLEQFFDYERKHFFKERLKALLLSITRNKVRKEKLVLIVHFHRFVRNALLSQPSSKLKDSKEPNKASSRALKPVANTNSRTTVISYDSGTTKRSTKTKQDTTRDANTQKANEKERLSQQKRYRKLLACTKLTHTLRDFTSRNFNNLISCFSRVKEFSLERKFLELEILVDQIQLDNSMFSTKFSITQSSLSSKVALMDEILTLVPK